jgi:phosphoribosylaminoimidazole (AIR) synthetase
MGIGFLSFINEEDIDDIMHHFSALGETPHLIGEISARGTDEPEVLLV